MSGIALAPRRAVLIIAACSTLFAPAAGLAGEGSAAPRVVLVRTTADHGAGSLREALERAQAASVPVRIRFDAVDGPFGTPQTIRLASELPAIGTTVEVDGYIEDRLWEPSGITLSGDGRHRVFSVAAGGRLTLRALGIAAGRADHGGGVHSRGMLVLHGVTLVDNTAQHEGGAVNSDGGRLVIVNSTLARNSAATGGAVASTGETVITNATFAGNSAALGGALFSSGDLLVRNSILADSRDGTDCVHRGRLLPGSAPNLIEAGEGCGTPFSSADPRLGPLDYYNGPTRTMPLNGGSPAINVGDNAAAMDEDGRPLTWDQRGNGDPRYVAGITDLGAFEVQVPTSLRVDTPADRDLRECSPAPSDCSLRGAIHLANATPGPDVIHFDEAIFPAPATLALRAPLPPVTSDLRLDATGSGAITLSGADDALSLQAAAGVRLELAGVGLAAGQGSGAAAP